MESSSGLTRTMGPVKVIAVRSCSLSFSGVRSQGGLSTIFLVHFFYFEDILAVAPVLVIELIPARRGSDLGAREASER